MPADVIIDPTNGQIYWNDGTGTPQSISIKGDALNAISFVGYSGSYSPGSAPGGAQTLATFNDSSLATFVPGTNAFELGSATLRWKFYGTTGNFSDGTGTTNLSTGSVLFNGGIAISGGASIGQTLYLYGVGTASTSYTGLRAGSAITNTIYTLPIVYPATGTSVLSSDTTGLMSWIPMTATSASSGGTVSSGTQYQIAGYYAGTGASVAGSSTFTNNTAIGQVQILHTTASTGTSIGALQVAGGVGISGKLTFNQASFGTTGISSLPTMAMIGQTGDPIYMSVLEDNSISFEGSQGQLFSISPNLTTGYIWAVNDISGVPLLRSNVNGNSFIAEFGGNLGVGQTNPTYKLDLKGNFGLASSNDALYNFIFSNTAASGSNSLQIRSANSILFYSSDNNFYTGFKSRASINKIYLLPATDGSSGQFLQTDGAQNLSWATATGGAGGGSTGVGAGGQYEVAVYPGTGASVLGYSSLKNDFTAGVVSISHSTVSTNYTNGAFTVSGGVGIGGSLFVGGIGASISGVTLSNSIITRGTWNGTVISTVYGGTGLNLTGTSGVLTVSSGTVSASTTSSAISSAISDKTGSGALTFATSPDFTTSVTTGSGTFAVFNTNATTINAFGAATTLSLGAATGTATFNSTNNSTATNNGSVVFSGGVGIGKSVSVGGRLLLFNGSTYTGFASSQVGTGSTIYFLPPSSPATGTSVLQSDSTGVMSWVPMVATSSGAGSGTVAIPDAQYRVAYYAGTGASVSSTSLITAVGTGVSILGATNATSNITAALSILGGLGITGNAFIGGTVYAPSTNASNISNVIFTNGIITSGSWSATAITSFYGGTGYATYTNGDLLVGFGGTLAKLPASANTGYVLTSTGSGSVPSWQSVPPSAASSVAVAPTTVGAQFSITIVNTNSGTGLGLSTVASLVINPSNGLVSMSGLAVTVGTNASTTQAAALTVLGGLGITGNAFIGGTTVITNNTSSSSISSGALSVTGGLGLAGNAFIGGTTVFTNSQSSSSTNSGSVTLAGGIGIVGNAFIGGTVNITSSTTSIGTNSGALVVTGGVGIGGSLFTATGSSSSISGVVLANNTINASTYNKVTITAPSSSATLTLVDGSTLSTAGANSLTLTTTAPTNSTFPAGTKTLVATDVASLTSLTTIGVITSGTWSATAITSFYGGTGYATYTVGDLLVGFGGTLAKLPVSSTSGQVLTSNGTGSVPSWQAVPSAAASSVAVTPTTVGAQFYIPVVNSASSAAIGLSTVSTLVVNPNTGLVSLSGLAVTAGTNSSSTQSGALQILGGLGITGNAFIGGTVSITNNTSSIGTNYGALVVTGGVGIGLSASIGGRLQMFNGSLYTAIVGSQSGVNTTYILPPTSPSSIGASFLTSTQSGTLAWISAPSGGSGSPGGSNKQIQYNNSTAFGGASGFEYTTGGIAVTVSVFSPSGTGYTSGLWINAIDGATTRVGIGLSNPAYELEILGEISATNKSFVIDHPTKSGMKLRYGSLEGPENGVYVRGELKGTNIIEVPDHWIGLVHKDSYTVHLTPIGRFSHLYVEKIENYNVYIADNMMCPIHCYYSVWAERKDIPKLVTEYEAQ